MQCRKRLPFVIAAAVAIAWIDSRCGPELSLWVAYVVPVAVASRYCGFSIGAFYAVLAGLLLCLAAKYSGHPYSSEGYFLFATWSQMLVFLVIAWLASRLSSLEARLRRIRYREYPMRSQ